MIFNHFYSGGNPVRYTGVHRGRVKLFLSLDHTLLDSVRVGLFFALAFLETECLVSAVLARYSDAS